MYACHKWKIPSDSDVSRKYNMLCTSPPWVCSIVARLRLYVNLWLHPPSVIQDLTRGFRLLRRRSFIGNIKQEPATEGGVRLREYRYSTTLWCRSCNNACPVSAVLLDDDSFKAQNRSSFVGRIASFWIQELGLQVATQSNETSSDNHTKHAKPLLRYRSK